MICIKTNDYANKHLNTPGVKRQKTDEKWYDLPVLKLRAYFALYVNMGQVKKSDVKKYWSRRKMVETPIYSVTMSCQRFSSISRFLHFHDQETEQLVETSTSDKLPKIRPTIKYLETKIYTRSNLS